MARPHDRKRQKKLQKAKNKRELARRKRDAQALRWTPQALTARALTAPFGPCWISAALEQEPGADGPALISTVVTRRVGGLLLASILLVDRTCLGIKNAFVAPAQTELDLERMLGNLASAGDPLQKTDLLTAQSVIYHALDYASSLGFAPHRDFVAGLIGERPSVLLDTPLARPERPLYVPGPDDDVQRIRAQLEASVGRGNYDVMDIDALDVLASFAEAFGADADADDAEDDDFDGDDFDDDDPEVLTTEGSEIMPAGEPTADMAADDVASDAERATP